MVNDGNDPISGVDVRAEGTPFSTTTDAGGNYSLAVPEGVYNLAFSKEGYYNEAIMDVFVNGADVDLPVRVMSEGMGGGMTGDTSKPMVLWTGPPDGMVGVPPNEPQFKIFIGFSKDINAATFTAENVYFTTDGTTPIAASGLVFDNDPSDNQAAGLPEDNFLGIVSPPTGGFTADTTYYLVLSESIRDTSGNGLQGNRPEGGYVTSFTTGVDFSGQDDWSGFGEGAMMPPYVLDVKPSPGTLNVSPNTRISVKFSEPMASDSVLGAGNIKLQAVTLLNGQEHFVNISIGIGLDTSGQLAMITPPNNLASGRYRLVVSGALQSANGIWVGDPNQSQNVSSFDFYTSDFEVGATSAVDEQSPEVLGTWPTNNEINVPVNPGAFNVQFSENIDPSTVNTNTVTLKRGSSVVNCAVMYDPMSQAVNISPNSVLATDTNYTLTVLGGASGVTDMSGNALTDTFIVTFSTTASGDDSAPAIMFANGDEHTVAVTFNEPMNAANPTDTANWASSVLNSTNYIIKWGDPGTVQGSGTVVDLTGASFNYDSVANTVIIEGLGLDLATIAGKDYFIEMDPATVGGSGVKDLSNNLIGGTTDFQFPINNSTDTKGMLGPMSGGGMVGPDMGAMGMMMGGAFPMNSMAGQTTTYFVDVPTTRVIPIGGKIILTFPTGFNVAGAVKDQNSPVNNDINEGNQGTVTITSVTGAQASKTITIVLGGVATQDNDYLHMDIAGIINSSIPRGPETGGYSVDIKTMDNNGKLLENISTMPFFISAGGDRTLTVTVNGVIFGDNGNVSVFLDSPMTGPVEKEAVFNGSTSEQVSFTGLPEGQFMLFTEPVVTLGAADYSGMPMPEPITIGQNPNIKTITLSKEQAGAGKKSVTVNITGSFGTDDIDVFAGSPNGFKVKTIQNAGDNPSATLYLPDGHWMVGMGPAMPKGPMGGPPPMPDWMSPQSVDVIISDNATQIDENSATVDDGVIALVVSSANMQIIGYLKDTNGNAIADADAWAYQPNGGSMGSNARTDTNGKFVLKIAQQGRYSVGVAKQGLPFISEKSIDVRTNTGDVDGNVTADNYFSKTLITDENILLFRVKKSGYTISGKVTDGSNPISFAPVWADQTTGWGHADTMTDAVGNYILFVENGTWLVKANIPGYGDIEPQQVVVNNDDVVQNLAPNSAYNYYSISGKVGVDTDGDFSTVENAFAFMPIRAVEYNDQGDHLGREYSSMTDSQGVYVINVPAGIYRVDIWTPEYGELGINNQDNDNNLNEPSDDDYANNPANLDVTAGDVVNADIIIANTGLRTVTLAFENAQANQEGFLNIDGLVFPNGTNNPPEPTGFHQSLRITDLAGVNTVNLSDGDYAFWLDVPELGGVIPNASPDPNGRDAVKDLIVVSADRTVGFSLPDMTDNSQVVNISGNVYQTAEQGGNELEAVWVWIGNPDTGYNFGVQTAPDGTYSFDVPNGAGYKMGADKPGYMSQEPVDINANTDLADRNFVLIQSAQTISGHLYQDANANNIYDVGEEVPNGFVRAETTDGSQMAHGPADGSGYFEVGVVDGTWKVYGMADGYQESLYGSNVEINGGSLTVNIKLTADDNWTNRNEKVPMTPASGGIVDGTNPDGTGIRLVFPPNALGSSSSSGSVNAAVTNSVTRTNSGDPIGGRGVNITASDNSGQAITNLNDYIDIEMVMYKDEIETQVASGSLNYDRLKLVKLGYWDNTINDWVSISTNIKAYYKNEGDTEWKLYNDTFTAFVDTLPGDYTDYKIVLSGKVNHFTIFGSITPTDHVAPAAPSGLAVSGNNGYSSLVWSSNSEADILEYQIFRGSTAGFSCNDASQVNTSQVVGTSFWDNTIFANNSYDYYYKLTAVDTSGNISDCSSAVEVTYSYAGGGGRNSYRSLINQANQTYNSYSAVGSSSGASVSSGNVQSGQQNDSGSIVNNSNDVVSDVEDNQVVQPDTPVAPKPVVVKVKQKLNAYAQQLQDILADATILFKVELKEMLSKVGVKKRDISKEDLSKGKYIKLLKQGVKNVKPEMENKLNNFVTYGTPSTLKLGAGERAGIVNSYKSAFGKLPESQFQWEDVIKIGNGRWPSEHSSMAEEKAGKAFIKIYLRQADRKNPHDDAAITVMAYGLRPVNRNLDSEKRAIKIFKAIYDYQPSSAFDWDIVRAIGYSGAVR